MFVGTDSHDSSHRSWPLYGEQSPLHVSVIGFDAIIRITTCSLTTRTTQLTLALQFPNRFGVASKFVLPNTCGGALSGFAKARFRKHLAASGSRVSNKYGDPPSRIPNGV